ncbi:hypothetical protein [uncultured Vibrio sp.]|uniref:hypothetical protein n=1 Tax=uncultured Vibrio sp. TaxID=114054 RepID=UPI002639B4D7|nr:hypothetical protein [uncultured Vibrio sp.]
MDTSTIRDYQYHNYLIPENLGGQGHGLFDAMREAKKLSYKNPSNAWLLMVLSNTSYWAYKALGEELFRELSDGGKNILSSVTRPSGTCKAIDKDSYLAYGTWDYGSGIEHCDYVICGFKEAQTGEVFHLPISINDLIVRDNWRSVGLQGTSSHSFELSKQEIKSKFKFSLNRYIGDDNFYTPSLSPIMAIISIGVTYRLLEECRKELKNTNTSSQLYSLYSINHAKLCAAEALLNSVAEDIWKNRNGILNSDRGSLRSAICYSVSSAYDVGCNLASMFPHISTDPCSDFHHFFNELQSTRAHGQLSPALHQEAGLLLCDNDSDAFVF